MLARVMRWLPVFATVVVLGAALAGCGGEEPVQPAKVASLEPATDLGTALPSGWPQVTLPAGSSVTDTADDAGHLEVDFESQELAAAVAAFLDKQLIAAGFEKGSSSVDGDTVTLSYASGPKTAEVTLVETGATTTGTVSITDPTASTSASASASPSS